MVNYSQRDSKNEFLYPVSPYHGYKSPENQSFNLRLQQFASHVDIIASLHSNGKLSSQEANLQLQELWKNLDLSD